jgi:AcrR family transcriptional regulator
MQRTARATALPPEERRQAIAEATLELLLSKGPGAVTTRQIAEAAGIAEGTIFRAFADKDAVLKAAVDLAFDTAPTERALEAIDRSQPLDAQLTSAVRIIQERNSSIWRVVEAVGDTDVLRDREHQPPPDLVALADLLRPHARHLRHAPDLAARELRALTLALTHPALFGDEPMTPEAIVGLLLHGINKGPAAPC